MPWSWRPLRYAGIPLRRDKTHPPAATSDAIMMLSPMLPTAGIVPPLVVSVTRRMGGPSSLLNTVTYDGSASKLRTRMTHVELSMRDGIRQGGPGVNSSAQSGFRFRVPVTPGLRCSKRGTARADAPRENHLLKDWNLEGTHPIKEAMEQRLIRLLG